MNEAMRTSDEGIRNIKHHEGLRLKAYKCTSHKWTIGYGHTKTAKPGMEITPEIALELFSEDIKDAEDGLRKLVQVNLNQSQFDALMSFVFNFGEGKLATSTLLRKLNEGDYVGAASELPRWIHSDGKPTAGLISRRAAEKQMFLRDMPEAKEG